MAAVPQNANEKKMVEFLDLWVKSDVDLLMPYFHPDCVYTDMPYEPRRGEKEIRDFIAYCFTTLDLDIETLRIASRGNFVYTERIEHVTFHDGRKVDVPLAGVMELTDDGLLINWREYFDAREVEGNPAPESFRNSQGD